MKTPGDKFLDYSDVSEVKKCQGRTKHGGIRGISPPVSGREQKIALKMHENVSNFKKFLPAAPIGTAGTILF